MSVFGMEFNVKFPDIQYAVTEYDNFSIREVIKDGAVSGQFHLDLNNADMETERNLEQFKKVLGAEEVSLIDPTRELVDEYNIYIKMKLNSIQYDCMRDVLINIDASMNQ